MSYLFANENKSNTDEWWMISDGIEQFNSNRKQNVLTGKIKVFDKSMSAFQPQT